MICIAEEELASALANEGTVIVPRYLVVVVVVVGLDNHDPWRTRVKTRGYGTGDECFALEKIDQCYLPSGTIHQRTRHGNLPFSFVNVTMKGGKLNDSVEPEQYLGTADKASKMKKNRTERETFDRVCRQ